MDMQVTQKNTKKRFSTRMLFFSLCLMLIVTLIPATAVFAATIGTFSDGTVVEQSTDMYDIYVTFKRNNPDIDDQRLYFSRGGMDGVVDYDFVIENDLLVVTVTSYGSENETVTYFNSRGEKVDASGVKDEPEPEKPITPDIEEFTSEFDGVAPNSNLMFDISNVTDEAIADGAYVEVWTYDNGLPGEKVESFERMALIRTEVESWREFKDVCRFYVKAPMTPVRQQYMVVIMPSEDSALPDDFDDAYDYTNFFVGDKTPSEDGPVPQPKPAAPEEPTEPEQPVTPPEPEKPVTPAEPAAPTAPAAPPRTVNPTASTVFVNGASKAFEAYNIDGRNYFKLRDIAFVLNGTNKQFAVGYDNSTNTVTMSSGQPYTPTGGEMTAGDGKAKSAVPASSKIYLDGGELNFGAYNIGGNNFFKLVDIMNALDAGVTYNEGTGDIGIDTSKPHEGVITVSDAVSCTLITSGNTITGFSAVIKEVYDEFGDIEYGLLVYDSITEEAPDIMYDPNIAADESQGTTTLTGVFSEPVTKAGTYVCSFTYDGLEYLSAEVTINGNAQTQAPAIPASLSSVPDPIESYEISYDEENGFIVFDVVIDDSMVQYETFVAMDVADVLTAATVGGYVKEACDYNLQVWEEEDAGVFGEKYYSLEYPLYDEIYGKKVSFIFLTYDTNYEYVAHSVITVDIPAK